MLARSCQRRLARLSSLVWEKEAASGLAASQGCPLCRLEQCRRCKGEVAQESRAPGAFWSSYTSRSGAWMHMPLQQSRGLASNSSEGSSKPGENTLENEIEAARFGIAEMGREGSGERVERIELPIAGAEPPRLPSNETPVSRLLGSQGMAALQKLQAEALPGSLGPAVTSAIQEAEIREDQSSKLSSAESFDEVLESWQTMLEEGDYEGVMSQMGERGGDVASILAPLQQDKAKRDKEALRAKRRAHEEELQASFAARRVRMVDALGRAYATGKKKTSIARVWLRVPPPFRAGTGRIRVNGRPFDDYFKPMLARMEVMKPFELTKTLGAFDVQAIIDGGGVSGQAAALRHGIAKALQCWDPEVRPVLKAAGLLTRDSRIVERKKPGKAKARKSFQWVKR